MLYEHRQPPHLATHHARHSHGHLFFLSALVADAFRTGTVAQVAIGLDVDMGLVLHRIVPHRAHQLLNAEPRGAFATDTDTG